MNSCYYSHLVLAPCGKTPYIFKAATCLLQPLICFPWVTVLARFHSIQDWKQVLTAHSNALVHTETPPEYLVLTNILWKIIFWRHLSSLWMNCRAIHSENWVNSVLKILFVLSESSFICQIKGQELMVSFCLSKWLGWGKLEFLSPSTERYLRLMTLWTPSDYLYLIRVLHRHVCLNLWM